MIYENGLVVFIITVMSKDGKAIAIQKYFHQETMGL